VEERFQCHGSIGPKCPDSRLVKFALGWMRRRQFSELSVASQQIEFPVLKVARGVIDEKQKGMVGPKHPKSPHNDFSSAIRIETGLDAQERQIAKI
jgi:hypothetical protein